MTRLRALTAAGFVLTAFVVAACVHNFTHNPGSEAAVEPEQAFTKDELAHALGDAGSVQEYPSEIELPVDGKPTRMIVQYAFDATLQHYMENQFKTYRPDYGAFVALDAKTGRVLSMVSYAHRPKDNQENLTLRATFPSASIFKIVTAAAAIAERDFSANTVVPFNGRNHTLYKSNVLKDQRTRWTRYIPLKDAFAQSVNTVFGKIGVFTVGPEHLRSYAERFGFNRRIAADIQMQEGRAVIPDEPWKLAESASGFTRETTMSPLQGALIAAAVVNDGTMMEPYVVESVHSIDGTTVYEARPKTSNVTVDSATAAEIRELMKRTISRGTSRKAFRGFARGQLAEVDVGGKTGSLTGRDPAGKYDWFVGFAEGGGRKVAIAALTVHERLWRVKSSHIARTAIEKYFRDPTLRASRR